jgi:hypothetical protein
MTVEMVSFGLIDDRVKKTSLLLSTSLYARCQKMHATSTGAESFITFLKKAFILNWIRDRFRLRS